MKEIIITTPDELRTLIEEAVRSSIHPPQIGQAEPPDTITLAAALELLRDNGYPTSKGKIYKLTSANQLPHRKYGNKLVFSRRDLLGWQFPRPAPSPTAAPKPSLNSPKVPGGKGNLHP